jgi:ribosomal silencing factor RsfS
VALDKAHTAIARSEVFIVMLGSKTKNAPGVLKEVKIANELKKTKFQIIGYKDGSRDWAVADAGRVYEWNWENLKVLLA